MRWVALVSAVLILPACAPNASPPARPPAPPPDPVEPTPAPAPDAATPSVTAADPVAGWVASLKERIPAAWTYLEVAPDSLYLFDREVDGARIRKCAALVSSLVRDEFETRFPPAGPVRGPYLFRVCKDGGQFRQYGGSSGARGHWNPSASEAVTYEDRTDRDHLQGTLQSLAFLQYLDRTGSPGAHDWFKAGLAACYSASRTDASGRWSPRVSRSWEPGFRSAASAGLLVPLREFVQYTRSQHFGPAAERNSAQAWGLAWFLLRTEDPGWKGILTRYHSTLRDRISAWRKDHPPEPAARPAAIPEEVQEAAREAALAAAFKGFDDAEWRRLEKDYAVAGR